MDHDDHQDLLDDLMAQVAPCFARRETRLTCKDMVHGLSRARCDERRMLDTAASWAVGRLSAAQDEDDVVLIVDLCRSWNYAEAPAA